MPGRAGYSIFLSMCFCVALPIASDALTLDENSLIAILPGASGDLAAWDTTPLASGPYGTTVLQLFMNLLQEKFGARAQLISKPMIDQMETIYHVDVKASNAVVLALSRAHYTHAIAIARGSTTSAGTTMKLYPSAILENASLSAANPFTITLENDDGGDFPGKIPDPVSRQLMAEFGPLHGRTDNKNDETENKKMVEIGCFTVQDDEKGSPAYYVARHLPVGLKPLYMDSSVEDGRSGRLFKLGYTLSELDRNPPKPDCLLPNKGTWKGLAGAEYSVTGVVSIDAPDAVGYRDIQMLVYVDGPATKTVMLVAKAPIELSTQTPDISEFGKAVIKQSKLLDAYIMEWVNHVKQRER